MKDIHLIKDKVRFHWHKIRVDDSNLSDITHIISNYQDFDLDEKIKALCRYLKARGLSNLNDICKGNGAIDDVTPQVL